MFEYLCWWLVSSASYIAIGYLVLLPILLVYYYSNKSKKAERLLSLNSLVFAIWSLILLSYPIYDFYVGYMEGHLEEQYDFYNRALGSFYYLSTITSFISYTAGLLFFHPKVRSLLSWTILIPILSCSNFLFNKIYFYLLTDSRDFLPSSWSYELPWYEPCLTWTIATAIQAFILFLLYRWTALDKYKES